MRWHPSLIADEVGCLSLETESAKLFFQLILRRCECAFLFMASDLPFSGWAEVVGNYAVAAAIIDQIDQHAYVIIPKRSGYQFKNPST